MHHNYFLHSDVILNIFIISSRRNQTLGGGETLLVIQVSVCYIRDIKRENAAVDRKISIIIEMRLAEFQYETDVFHSRLQVHLKQRPSPARSASDDLSISWSF